MVNRQSGVITVLHTMRKYELRVYVCTCVNCIRMMTLTPLSHGHNTRILPEFWHSHGHVNPGLTRVLDPACEQGFDPGSRPAYIITVSQV